MKQESGKKTSKGEEKKKKLHRRPTPILFSTQTQLPLKIFFPFIQWQTLRILQINKPIPKVYITSTAKQKVISKGEADLFTMKRTVENKKGLSSGHLRNNCAELVRVITIDDTENLDLNIVILSIILAWLKGPIILFFEEVCLLRG